MCSATDGRLGDVIKNTLEVIEEDGIRCAFEDERELPWGQYRSFNP